MFFVFRYTIVNDSLRKVEEIATQKEPAARRHSLYLALYDTGSCMLSGEACETKRLLVLRHTGRSTYGRDVDYTVDPSWLSLEELSKYWDMTTEQTTKPMIKQTTVRDQ